jgi:copper(I)-binding protein
VTGPVAGAAETEVAATPRPGALTELLRGAVAPVTCAVALVALLSAWVASGGDGSITRVTIDVSAATIAMPATPGGEAVAYLSLENLGSAQRLVSATTPDARDTEFVQHDGSAAGPGRLLSTVPIPAHGDLSLSPFQSDIVLVHPAAMTPGEVVPLTLTFSGAGRLTVQATVTPPGTP